MNKLTLVTTTNRIDGWIDYCQHIKSLQDLYGNKFDVLILDNAPERSSEIKKELLLDCIGKKGFKTVKYLHYDTFVECRNQQRFQVETPFLTILDDDDKLCDGFLYILEFILSTLGHTVDYVNLSKIKYGMGTHPYKGIQFLNSFMGDDKIKLENFYDYDNYNKDRLVKVYPINGYCILSSDLYRNYGETFEHYVDDCYPMMNCYLNCKHGFKVGLPWQYYKVQNRYMSDYERLENCEISFLKQMERLKKENPTSKVVRKQIENLVKVMTIKFQKDGIVETYKPNSLIKFLNSYDRT